MPSTSIFIYRDRLRPPQLRRLHLAAVMVCRFAVKPVHISAAIAILRLQIVHQPELDRLRLANTHGKQLCWPLAKFIWVRVLWYHRNMYLRWPIKWRIWSKFYVWSFSKISTKWHINFLFITQSTFDNPFVQLVATWIVYTSRNCLGVDFFQNYSQVIKYSSQWFVKWRSYSN